MPVCFFIGHRDAPETLFPALLDEVERHIVHHGVTEFVVGQYGRFDSMAARAVAAAKERHSDVALTLLLPYHPALRPVTLREGFDGALYPPDMEKVPLRLAIVRANHWMMRHSEFLIAYAWQPGSNARELVDRAQPRVRRGELRVTMLDRV